MPTFRSWFSDSKIVDGQGNPLVVFHGTPADFNIFETGGAYFSACPGYASTTAQLVAEAREGNAFVMAAFLRVTTPAILPADAIEGLGYDEREIEKLERKGFDGAMTFDANEIFVFDPKTQVKAAFGNSGTFASTADICH
jgi:hypothetical protein